MRPMVTKFGKQASTGFKSKETNQADAADIITSRSRDQLKSLYLYYHTAYGHQIWQDGKIS